MIAETTEVSTLALIGDALDWVVAQIESNVGWQREGVDRDNYSTDWAHARRIIEREHIEFDYDEATQLYRAYDGIHGGVGKTHLIAAMRCFVASKMGITVRVPTELL